MKKTFYFSHDINARNDEKILIMRVDYKYKGYGWYWAIVETMAEASEYRLKLNGGNIKGMSLSLNISAKKLEKFINDCIDKYKLFAKDKSGQYFYAESLLKRLNKRDDITNRLKEAGYKGAEARWGGHKHPIEVPNNSEKEKYSDNVYMTKEEMGKLEKEYGKELIEDYIEKLNRYIVEHILSGKRKPYQSHYLTIKAWIRKAKKDESGSGIKDDSYVNLREEIANK